MATEIIVLYYRSAGMHLGRNKYVYTNMYKSAEKSKINDFNSPRNKPLIILNYWSKNIEEYFHLRNPDNINLSENL